METTPDRPHQCAETALVKVSLTHAAKSCGCFSVHVSLTSQQHWLQLPLPEVHHPPECSFPLGSPGPRPHACLALLLPLQPLLHLLCWFFLISLAGNHWCAPRVHPKPSSSSAPIPLLISSSPRSLPTIRILMAAKYSSSTLLQSHPLISSLASLAAAYLTFPFLTGILT